MLKRIFFLLTLLTSNAFAQEERIVTLPYTKDIIKVQTTPLHVTVVELGQEQVQSIIVGDSERWRIQHTIGTDGKPLIVIKPTKRDISTNLVITTNQRVYNIELISGSKANYHAYVRFGYPGQDIIHVSPPITGVSAGNAAAEAVSQTAGSSSPSSSSSPAASNVKSSQQKDYDYNYRWDRSQDFPWSPVSIYNDGQRTYIRIPDVASRYELPVLYVYEDGKPVVVNYIVRDNVYVVDRIFRNGELVLGADIKRGLLGLLGHKEKARRLRIYYNGK